MPLNESTPSWTAPATAPLAVFTCSPAACAARVAETTHASTANAIVTRCAIDIPLRKERSVLMKALASRPAQLRCDRERGVGRRYAGVDRGLQQHLLDVGPFEAGREAGAQVQAELLPPRERSRDREHEGASRLDA